MTPGPLACITPYAVLSRLPCAGGFFAHIAAPNLNGIWSRSAQWGQISDRGKRRWARTSSTRRAGVASANRQSNHGIRLMPDRVSEGAWVRRTTRLALSAAAGLAAAVLAWMAIAGARAEAEEASRRALEQYGGELARVCVATTEIEPGDEIDEGNVKVVEWVASLMPEGALTSMSDAIGLVATTRIPSRSPIAEAHFAQEGQEIQVPRGTVAVSVASDAEHAVGGSLARGDGVDVYVADASVADRLTRAEVLDTSVLAEGGGELRWVTLAVDSSAVREVLAATTRGEVTLVLPGASNARESGPGSGDAEGD